jgi:PhnB protein
MRLNSYLSFKGNCEDALNFYKDVLGAEVTTFLRFDEAPEEVMQVSENDKQLVMHATLEFEGNVLMMSDHLNQEYNQGNTFSLSINASEDEAYAMYHSLIEGGQTVMPFAEAFWGGKFGMLVDKFGVQWMFTTQHKPV